MAQAAAQTPAPDSKAATLHPDLSEVVLIPGLLEPRPPARNHRDVKAFLGFQAFAHNARSA